MRATPLTATGPRNLSTARPSASPVPHTRWTKRRGLVNPHVQLLSDYLLDHRYPKQARVDWLPEHAYHRPLAAYVNELAQAGLRLDRLAEVHQSDADAGEVPNLLYARATKLNP